MGGSRRGPAPRRHGRRHGRRRTPLLVVALAAASSELTACGDDDPEAVPTPAPASSTTTSAPTTEPAEPTASATPEPQKRPRSANTPKGRKEFTAFVVERWGHALATNDATVVSSLSPKGATCQGCRELRAELGRRTKQGWFVDFPGAEVKRVTVRPGDATGVWAATARISVPESRSYFDDGTYRNDNKAHPDVAFTVRMRHQAGRFVLLAFSIG